MSARGLLERLTGSARRRAPSRRRAEPDAALAAGRAAKPGPLAVDYVRNHVSGEEYPLETARRLVGEWQPESERAELRAFLVDRDPSDPASNESRDFSPLGSGAVVLSRGVRFVAPPAVSVDPPGERTPSASRTTGYTGAIA